MAKKNNGLPNFLTAMLVKPNNFSLSLSFKSRKKMGKIETVRCFRAKTLHESGDENFYDLFNEVREIMRAALKAF